jgi:Secretion system C-terminal sorting domain
MNKILFKAMLFIFTAFYQISYAQISISPNHTITGSGACPGVSITYTVTGTGSCGVIIELFSGNVVSFTANNSNKTFTVTWSDVPQQAQVDILPANGSCFSPTTKLIPVLSVSGLQPTISGCPTLFVGKNEAFNLTAQLLYSFNGDNDPDEVQGYQWGFQSGGTGWSISTVNQNGVANSLAQVTTDLGNDAVIRVRGQSLCGGWSNWRTCNIVRAAKPPCPIIGAPAFVLCGVTDPITMLPTIDQTLTGYSYSWTYPAGWSGNATGNVGTVTPNGINGGVVTLVATAFGKTSTPCTKNIPLEPIVPSTVVSGGDYVCNLAPTVFNLSIPPPPGASTTWTVSPSNATIPSSGTGIQANITESGNFNGTATITFTVTTACGVRTRTKSFFVGKPKFLSVKVDGNEASSFIYICPNGGLGSHSVLVTLQGDEDGCVDEWDATGVGFDWEGCLEYDFTLQYNPNSSPPYNCVTLDITAENQCGTNTKYIIICPSYGACDRFGFVFQLSPNPAQTIVNVELYLELEEGLREQSDFDQLQLLDKQGNVLRTYEVPEQSIQLDVSNLKDGMYYLRTWIEEGGYVMEELLIQRD